MCGRVTLDFTLEQLKEMLEDDFDITSPKIEAGTYKPRYNIAPGQQLLNVISDGRQYRAGYMKWGFVPQWAKDPSVGYKMINARSETASAKPSFKSSFKTRRCIILADSFFEWDRKGSEKLPYRILSKDRSYMALAGLWSSWHADGSSPLYTCTVLTTSANTLVGEIHHRMPVILPQETTGIWLARETSTDDLQKLMKPYDPEKMTMYAVSSLVNSVGNDGPALIEPV